MKIELVEGAKYSDRQGRIYSFVEKRGGVTVFLNEAGAREVRNSSGGYRWDGKEDDRDVVAFLIED